MNLKDIDLKNVKIVPVSFAEAKPEMVSNEKVVLDFVQAMQETVSSMLNSDGTFKPSFFIMGYRDTEPVILVFTPPLFKTDADIALAESAVKSIAEYAKAFGVLACSRTISVDIPVKDKNEAKQAIQEWVGKVDKHIDKKDQMWMYLEHRMVGNKTWYAEITKVDGKLQVGPFEEQLDTESLILGSFKAFLPTLPNATLN